jgi:hypothetical protein
MLGCDDDDGGGDDYCMKKKGKKMCWKKIRLKKKKFRQSPWLKMGTWAYLRWLGENTP